MMILLPLIVNVIFVKSADHGPSESDDSDDDFSTMPSDKKIQWIKVFY